jgi:hypothetical protein
MKGQRTLIEEVVSSIDTKAKKKMIIKLTLSPTKLLFIEKLQPQTRFPAPPDIGKAG